MLFLLRILVHELMHGHVELVLGVDDALDLDERVILQWEDKYAKAQSKSESIKVLHDFVAEIEERR